MTASLDRRHTDDPANGKFRHPLLEAIPPLDPATRDRARTRVRRAARDHDDEQALLQALGLEDE